MAESPIGNLPPEIYGPPGQTVRPPPNKPGSVEPPPPPTPGSVDAFIAAFKKKGKEFKYLRFKLLDAWTDKNKCKQIILETFPDEYFTKLMPYKESLIRDDIVLLLKEYGIAPDGIPETLTKSNFTAKPVVLPPQQSLLGSIVRNIPPPPPPAPLKPEDPVAFQKNRDALLAVTTFVRDLLDVIPRLTKASPDLIILYNKLELEKALISKLQNTEYSKNLEKYQLEIYSQCFQEFLIQVLRTLQGQVKKSSTEIKLLEKEIRRGLLKHGLLNDEKAALAQYYDNAAGSIANAIVGGVTNSIWRENILFIEGRPIRFINNAFLYPRCNAEIDFQNKHKLSPAGIKELEEYNSEEQKKQTMERVKYKVNRDRYGHTVTPHVAYEMGLERAFEANSIAKNQNRINRNAANTLRKTAKNAANIVAAPMSFLPTKFPFRNTLKKALYRELIPQITTTVQEILAGYSTYNKEEIIREINSPCFKELLIEYLRQIKHEVLTETEKTDVAIQLATYIWRGCNKSLRLIILESIELLLKTLKVAEETPNPYTYSNLHTKSKMLQIILKVYYKQKRDSDVEARLVSLRLELENGDPRIDYLRDFLENRGVPKTGCFGSSCTVPEPIPADMYAKILVNINTFDEPLQSFYERLKPLLISKIRPNKSGNFNFRQWRLAVSSPCFKELLEKMLQRGFENISPETTNTISDAFLNPEFACNTYLSQTSSVPTATQSTVSEPLATSPLGSAVPVNAPPLNQLAPAVNAPPLNQLAPAVNAPPLNRLPPAVNAPPLNQLPPAVNAPPLNRLPPAPSEREASNNSILYSTSPTERFDLPFVANTNEPAQNELYTPLYGTGQSVYEAGGRQGPHPDERLFTVNGYRMVRGRRGGRRTNKNKQNRNKTRSNK